MRARALVISTLMLCMLGAPAAFAQDSAPSGGTPPPSSPPPAPDESGGTAYGAPIFQPTVPGLVAVLKDGVAYAPEGAPPQVKTAIWAANDIQGKPYVYGGGHGAFKSSGYDCSGTVSYALHGGGLLRRPLDSRRFMRWGEAGPGAWISVYANRGHAFAIIAGLRLDTSGTGGKGPRWRPEPRPLSGYRVRHPLGF